MQPNWFLSYIKNKEYNVSLPDTFSQINLTKTDMMMIMMMNCLLFEVVQYCKPLHRSVIF